MIMNYDESVIVVSDSGFVRYLLGEVSFVSLLLPDDDDYGNKNEMMR